jgi:hypothetical protein
METLGTFESYEQLHALLRTRAEELKISRLELDSLAGLQRGYAAKLLSPRPIKKLGFASMPLLLDALGLSLAVLIDDEKTAALHARIRGSTRRENCVHADVVHVTYSRRHMRKIARLGGALSRSKMSKRRASELGKRAARARWKKAA